MHAYPNSLGRLHCHIHVYAALAKRQVKRKPETWSGQQLSAISAVKEAAATARQQQQVLSSLLAGVENLQLLLETAVMGMLEEAFQQPWG